MKRVFAIAPILALCACAPGTTAAGDANADEVRVGRDGAGDSADRVEVGADASTDVATLDAAADAGTTFPPWNDLCSPPPGNLVSHGDFEEGLVNMAPAFWEVRNPSQPAACAGSGTPAEHLFISAGPTACGGMRSRSTRAGSGTVTPCRS